MVVFVRVLLFFVGLLQEITHIRVFVRPFVPAVAPPNLLDAADYMDIAPSQASDLISVPRPAFYDTPLLSAPVRTPRALNFSSLPVREWFF
jgi:hypothetical protein